MKDFAGPYVQTLAHQMCGIKNSMRKHSEPVSREQLGVAIWKAWGRQHRKVSVSGLKYWEMVINRLFSGLVHRLWGSPICDWWLSPIIAHWSHGLLPVACFPVSIRCVPIDAWAIRIPSINHEMGWNRSVFWHIFQRWWTKTKRIKKACIDKRSWKWDNSPHHPYIPETIRIPWTDKAPGLVATWGPPTSLTSRT